MSTDHGAFVVINVYVPNAGPAPDRPRLHTKLAFLRALKRRADAFVSAGREVRQRACSPWAALSIVVGKGLWGVARVRAHLSTWRGL